MNSNRTNWLAIALTLVIAGLSLIMISGGAKAAEYEHEISFGTSLVSGDPDETVTYIATIENKGTADDTYALTIVSVVPTGWNMYVLPSSISIGDDSQDTVTVYVEIGNRTQADGGKSYHFTVYCKSGGSANNETVGGTTSVNNVYGNSLSTGTNSIAVDPNNAATFT